MPSRPSSAAPRSVTFSITPHRANLPLMGVAVRAIVAEMKLGVDATAALDMAVIELVANLIRTGYSEEAPEGALVPSLTEPATGAQVVMTDQGRPMMPLAENEVYVCGNTDMTTLPDSAHSLLLACAMVDKLSYAHLDGCNVLELTCHY